MFPQVAPKFFKIRPDGPKNLGKDPVKKVEVPAAAGAGNSGNGKALGEAVNYVITLNGREHRVSVAPAK